MSEQLRFDGRVALVTGAGGGLGRCYALAFAERGAKVVVNDLGGGMHGDGASSSPAQKVVDEISAKGGTAVANCDSVEEGENIIRCALDNYGRIDIIVNNAGILRDRSFARISDTDWDLVHRVHLRGAFQVTRAAWPHMRKQGYGRIIMTASNSGVYGNFGQANYSAAKLGLLGLSNTLAIEGSKYNIHCNAIVPTAGSRLTLTIMPPEVADALKPELVEPLVTWLCHELCEDTGGLYEAAAGYYAKLRWQRSEGRVLGNKDKPVSAEQVRDNWTSISDFAKHSYPQNMNEASAVFNEMVYSADKESSSDTNTTGTNTIETVIGRKLPTVTINYTERDVILYALGIGVSTAHNDHLHYLYENSENFTVMPTFLSAQAIQMSTGLTQIPELNIDPTQILHGEQFLEIFEPIPTCATLTAELTITDILDKKSGAAIILDVDTLDENGTLIAHNQITVFVRGMGNFGGKRNSPHAKPTLDHPSRKPDATVEEKTSIDQAALYRLSGDLNPLHIDPSFAAMGGLDQPILHGLCFFGMAVRHVLCKFCGGDSTQLRAVKVRFSSMVVPGQGLRTDMWKEGSRIYFETTNIETGKVCLSGGYVDVKNPSNPGLEGSQIPSNPDTTAIDKIFTKLSDRIAQHPSLADKIKAIFTFNLTDAGKMVSIWTVDLRVAPGVVYSSPPREGKSDCSLTLAQDDFVNLATGKLNGQQAFLQGKLKIKGNIMLSQKLGILFQEQSKL